MEEEVSRFRGKLNDSDDDDDDDDGDDNRTLFSPKLTYLYKMLIQRGQIASDIRVINNTILD